MFVQLKLNEITYHKIFNSEDVVNAIKLQQVINLNETLKSHE